ncbi:MAG: flagellar biosynthetic protein FliR [Deltaproteobacteria bacterium]|nr:flagellar biosynthetic protein FliR [Deltaproteobacteria bacterium]
MIPLINNSDALVPHVTVFILVMTRIGSLFITAPMLNAKTIPVRIRVATCILVSLAVFVSLPSSQVPPLDAIMLTLAVLGEVCVGAAAGLSAQLIFAAVDGGGRLLGIPMGMGFSQAIDPLTGSNSLVIARFFGVLVMLLFIVMDIHHTLLRLVARSFAVLPPGHVLPSPAAAQTLLKNASLVFVGSVQLAAPVLLVLLGVMVAIGLLAKIAPKVNLFVLSFAISIALGLVALRAAIPAEAAWIREALMRIEPMAIQAIEGF